MDEYRKYINMAEFIIAIGNANIRERIGNRISDAIWYTALHPSAVISGIDVKIGEGTAVMANTVINSGSRIGKHCIVNSGAIVEHDNHLDNYVHISVSARLGGAVWVGKAARIGIGSSISNNVNICGGCMIGAGAVVVKDIREPGTYVSVPAGKVEKGEQKHLKNHIGEVKALHSFTSAFLENSGRAA